VRTSPKVLPVWVTLACLPAFAGAPPAPATQSVVYTHDFEKPVGGEWSHVKREQTPIGKRGFLGRFGKDTVVLTLGKLPKHRFVRVSFDLFIMGSWDANHTGTHEGPDIWDLRVIGGPRLLRTSFRCFESTPPHPTEKQSYPDPYPVNLHPRYTGAAETGTLGIGWGRNDMNAVYRIACAFPHTGAELKLLFSSTMAEGLDNESWGLDNVKVEVLADPPTGRLRPGALATLWTHLADGEPVKANRAVWTLIGAGNDVVASLKDRLKRPELAADVKLIASLIRELDSPKWAIREKATQALVQIGLPAMPMLRRTLEGDLSVEVRTRIGRIMAALEAVDKRQLEEGFATPELLRLARAVHVLQVIDSADSRRVLQSLADRSPHPQVRRLASDALKPSR